MQRRGAWRDGIRVRSKNEKGEEKKKWERRKEWIVLRGGMEYFCDVMYLIVDFLGLFCRSGVDVEL